MTSFLVALQFLTRIPIRLVKAPTDSQLGHSLLYYPLVGLLVGILLYVVAFLLSDANEIFRASIILCFWVIITGALHLDGLADSVDAFVGSHGDKEKALRIMKDPSCGPMGVTSLILILLLKFSVVIQLIDSSLVVLVLAPCLSRVSVIWSFIYMSYIRENGLGEKLSSHLPRWPAKIILLSASILIIIIFKLFGILLLLLFIVFLFCYRIFLNKKLGGMTGDTVGAQIEILEVLVLVAGYLFLVY